MMSQVNIWYNILMNILYCGDRGIQRGVLVSILSILKHNKGVLNFYILTINYEDTVAFTEKAAKFLDELVKKTNAKNSVKLIDASEVFVQNLPKKNMGSYFTPASMLRLYIDKVPEIADITIPSAVITASRTTAATRPVTSISRQPISTSASAATGKR